MHNLQWQNQHDFYKYGISETDRGHYDGIYVSLSKSNIAYLPIDISLGYIVTESGFHTAVNSISTVSQSNNAL